MSISSILSTASQGMNAQGDRLSAAASNISNIDTPGYQRVTAQLSTVGTGNQSGVTAVVAADQTAPSTGLPDLNETTEITDMIESETAFEANASVFEAGADLWQVLATIRDSNH